MWYLKSNVNILLTEASMALRNFFEEDFMKTKCTHNRLAAVFLALAMLLTSITFSSFAGVTANAAADPTYVFESSALTAATAGTFTDGQSAKAGTDDFFTLYYSAKTKIDKSEKDFDDGYSSDQRLNFGGKADPTTPKNTISFTTDAAATVKVWWAQGGEDNRQVVIYDKNGKEIAATTGTWAKNEPYLSTLEVPAAGTYFLGGKENNNYFFKVEVTVHMPKEYVLETSQLEAAAAGTFTDSQEAKAGTENFFTLYYSAKTKIDKSEKTFDDGYSSAQRINFGGKADPAAPKNAISFTTGGAATVKVWWAQGGDDNRQVVIYDKSGKEVAVTTGTWAKNEPYLSTLEVPAAGTYFLGGKENNNYFFKVQVIDGGGAPVERGDWGKVAAPVIGTITQDGGDIVVPVTADVSAVGGDKVVVEMTDSEGNVSSKQSLAEKTEHSLVFTPTTTGTYTFKATLSRDGETDKVSGTTDFAFTLPLSATIISSATSKGSGTIELIWNAVPEATGYEIYRVDGSNDVSIGTTTGIDSTKFIAEGLTVGTKYDFKVAAVRGAEIGPKSNPLGTIATSDAKSTWGYTIYGTSTDDKNNGYEGGVNTEEGKVTVYSEGGKGKLESGAVDGIMFYYTAVPSDKNFIFRAKMHVDSWKYSNGQEAMGLLASDSIPEEFLTKLYWTNNYYLTLGTVAYNWDSEKEVNGQKGQVVYDGTGVKYDMRCGLGVYPNLGVTKENQDRISELGLAATIDPNIQYPLDLTAANKGLDAGRYNIAGGSSNPKDTPVSIAELRDFDIEIRKNNTGYFFTYYDEKGNVIGIQKFYDTEALSHVDEDNVYVGFFAARNARATFSDISLEVRDPSQDPAPEERPVTLVTPKVDFKSSSVANTDDYTLMLMPNVDGTAVISVNDKQVATKDVVGETLFSLPVEINPGSNTVTVVFTPDPKQDLGEYTKLESTDPVVAEITVNYDTYYANQNNLYVAPNGKSTGNGGPEYPLDIYTAVSVVKPGQTIVIMEGTYNLTGTVRIERGMDGTADEPIRMIADPAASSRPVFDFGGVGGGIRHGGNYWYFRGFDVTRSSDKSTGFRVCGNNNTLDQIESYSNGNTGIQISAFMDSSDPKELWPQNNLILNCTSYNNADKGYEDADGFAAKITCGEGNVFDGCVSHHNADDGWDLFARASSGKIGAVTIKNCVAYSNGVLLDGTKAGNGNGFKLGGGNLPAGHKIINSIAFKNEKDGITCNSCPDITVENCTSYDNGGDGVALYTNDKNSETKFTVSGVVTNNIRFVLNTKDSSNIEEASKTPATADSFVSTEFNGFTRNADGTINLGDYLKLSDKAPEGAGADITDENGSTPSTGVGTITPDENLPDPKPEIITPPTPSQPSDPSTSDDKKPVEFEDENNDTDIEVTAPADAFDKADEVKFNAVPVPEETKDGQFTFDLTFTDKDGNKVQPKVAVTVKIPVPTALKDKTIYVYHVEDDGKYTEISCEVEDGMVVFTASKFSKYIITSEKLSAAENNSGDTDSSNSSGDSGSNNSSGDSGSGEGTNPSTGVAMPVAGMAVVVIGAALTVFVTKRKRG